MQIQPNNEKGKNVKDKMITNQNQLFTMITFLLSSKSRISIEYNGN